MSCRWVRSHRILSEKQFWHVLESSGAEAEADAAAEADVDAAPVAGSWPGGARDMAGEREAQQAPAAAPAAIRLAAGVVLSHGARACAGLSVVVVVQPSQRQRGPDWPATCD